MEAFKDAVIYTYLFSAEGSDLALPAHRDDVGAPCSPPAWIRWRKSISIGTSIIDLVYDEPISLHRRACGRCLCVDGEGPDLALRALTRADRMW